MMEDDSLGIYEIQCLAWYGMPSLQIRNCKMQEYEEVYEKNKKQFDQWCKEIDRYLEWEFALNAKVISIQNENYPVSLLDIGNDAPPVIHIFGNWELIHMVGTAVIGARAADQEGLDAAYNLGKRLTEEGKVVVSGLALGCDKAAHEGCLDAYGKTIAVVATGLGPVHPKENTPLEVRIRANGGAVITEHSFRTQANSQRLVARNRIQAALSQEVILAQCPKHSGSMHTMRFARKYHKKCYAVAYPHYTEINAGNKLLIDSNLASPLII